MAISEAEHRAGVREERWFLARLIMIFALIAAGIVLLAALRSLKDSSRFPRVRLSDGTWLVARAVTIGKTHVFEIHYSFSERFRRGVPGFKESVTTPTDRMVVWLTHENDQGEFLDMDWFSRSELVLTDDFKVAPKEYQRKQEELNAYGMGSSTRRCSTGSSGMAEAKPFAVATRKTQFAFVSCNLPLVRPREGSLRLDVFDGAKQMIGQLEIPYQPLPNILGDEWQPEQLPVTKSDGNLQVTLTGVKYRKIFGRISVQPMLTFVHDGQPSETWDHFVDITDQLGNVGQCWECDLSPLESSWKLRLRPSQRTDGRFLPEETKKLPPLALVPTRQFQPLSNTHIVNGLSITLVGIAGPGPVETSIPNSKSSISTKAYKKGQQDYGWSVDCGGTNCRFQFNAGYPFVVTSGGQSNAETSVQLAFRDQSGEDLKQAYSGGGDGLMCWFFDPLPTSTSIEIEIIVQRRRHVEFLIAPPSPSDFQEEKQ